MRSGLVILLLLISSWARAKDRPCFALVEVQSAASACVRFYRVWRPIVPLVNHVYIAVTWQNVAQTEIQVYGAHKGTSDLEFAQNALASSDLDSVRFLGSACGDDAVQALDRATEITQRWKSVQDSLLFMGPRYLCTPLLGRPCANAAQEIERAIKPYFDQTGAP